jgi:hypothetical protein
MTHSLLARIAKSEIAAAKKATAIGTAAKSLPSAAAKTPSGLNIGN